MERLSIEPGRAPFVGRTLELELLNDLARRASAGEPQAVFVEGSPGRGKTRLIDEFAARLSAAGWTVLRGEGDGLPAGSPYGPFVAALRSYTDVHGIDGARAAAGGWSRHLATAVPELAADGEPAPVDAAVIAEAWAQTVRALSATAPLLLAIDDLQWADAASLALLRYLRRRLRGTRLLLVCADRGDREDVAADADPAGEMARARLAVRLLLGRLDPTASVRLAEGLLGASAGPRLTATILKEGEGDPFIVEELVRGLADAGRLGAAPDDTIEITDDAPAGLPPGVRDALDVRLAGLDPEVRKILAHAAVCGRRVSLRAAVAAADRPADVVESALAAAARRGFGRPDGPDVFEFAHDKIREALYAGLSPAERRRSHDRVLGSLPPVADGGDPALLAHHAMRGERPERAIESLVAASTAASQAGAHVDAARHQAAAVEILRAAGHGRDLADALARLGGSLADAGAYDDASTVLDEALRLARAPDAVADPIATAAILERLGAIHLAREDPDRAEAALRYALAELDRHDESAAEGRVPAPEPGDVGPTTDDIRTDRGAASGTADLPTVRWRIELLLARLHVSVTGALDDGARLAGQVLAAASALGEARVEASAHAILGQAAMHAGDFPAGRRHFDAAIALVDPVRDPGLAADAADGLARLHYWTASFHQLEQVADRELAAARLAGDPHRLGWPTFWLAQAALGLGRWDEARSRATELVDLGDRLGARRMLGQGHELLGLAAWWTGAFDEACRELAAGVGHLRQIGPGALVYYLGPYGLALAAAGRAVEAEAVLAELDSLARGFPRGSSPRVQAFNVAVRIGLALGRRDPTAGEELRRSEGQFHWLPVATTLALRSLPSDPAAAERHAAAARALLVGGGGEIHLAGVLAVEAEIAARRGDGRSAVALRRAAEEVVRSRGASPVAAGIVAGVSQPPSVLPRGELSAREMQVLALVAAGHTNREIAEALAISEKTAVNHVTHILDKLGVSNRAAAASWAVRNGLV